MSTKKPERSPKYRVASLTGDGAPVGSFREAVEYAREWVQEEAGAVVIVEKREGAIYVAVRAFYRIDGKPKGRGRAWLARMTAAVAAGTVPWHRAFVTRTPA